MRPILIFFAALLVFSGGVLADERILSEISSRLEADAVIAVEMQAREAREADRKATIEDVPAFEEWEVDHGNRKTILRRVAVPAPQVTIQVVESTEETANEAKWTEEEIAAWMAEQPACAERHRDQLLEGALI
jgi:RNA-binding protein YhbY